MTGRFEPFDYQAADIDAIEAADGKALVVAEVGAGKAQPLHAGVLTPSGFIRMGDVEVGTTVVTPDGGTAQVLGVFPQGVRPVYRLTLRDGRQVEADADHLWTVSTDVQRLRGQTRLRTTEQIALDIELERKPWSIELTNPVDLGDWSSSLDPYLVGVLLGDGGLTGGTPTLSNPDAEIVEAVAQMLPEGVRMHAKAKGIDYYLTSGRRGGEANPLTVELRRLGLMGSRSTKKAMPEALLHASVSDRLALLQGILDTDGSPSRAGFEVTLGSLALIEQVEWLIQSLGGRSTLRSKLVDGSTYWRIHGRLPESMPPFRLTRKAEQVATATKYALHSLAIVSVEWVRDELTQCILVDHPDHEYVTDGFVRTHNTLIAIEAARRLGAKVVFVIAPSSTHEVEWGERIELQMPGTEVLIMDSPAAEREAVDRMQRGVPGWYIATHQRFAGWAPKAFTPKEKAEHRNRTGEKLENRPSRYPLRTWRLDMAVVDEIHMLSNRQSQGGEFMRKHLVARYRIGMSGTPLRNKFENFWNLLRWLWPERSAEGDIADTSFHRWVGRYAATQYNPHSRSGVEVVGEKNPGEIASLVPCYVQHFKRLPCCEFHQPDPENGNPTGGFMGHLPAPRDVEHIVPLTAEQRRLIDAMEESYVAWLSDAAESGKAIIAKLPIEARIRLRQMALAEPTVEDTGEVDAKTGEPKMQVTFAPGCASPKLDRFEQRLEQTEEPYLALTSSRQFAVEVERRLNERGYAAAMYAGGVSKKRRRQIRDSFSSGELDVVIAVVSAIGTGTDGLQNATHRLFWFDQSDDMTDNAQGEGRLDRRGQIEQVVSERVVSPGTMDAGIYSDQIARRLALNASIQRDRRRAKKR